jgi:predicted nucleic acid-binding Zn finger protein
MLSSKNDPSSPEKRNENREDRAQKAVHNRGVKLHRFHPSGRSIWTVVGTEGDALVTFNKLDQRQQYCSCDDFHFRVLGGMVSLCYHLIAAKIANEMNQYATIDFSDDEYPDFLRLLLNDIFSRIS